jgi:hypothetical protein
MAFSAREAWRLHCQGHSARFIAEQLGPGLTAKDINLSLERTRRRRAGELPFIRRPGGPTGSAPEGAASG